MLTPLNLQNITSFMNTNKGDKNSVSSVKIKAPFNLAEIKTENSFESIFSYEKKLQELGYNPDKKANLIEEKPLLEDEKLFPSFLKDPVQRGQEKMVMMIYDEDGNLIGSVGESGIATFRDYLSDVYHKFHKNHDILEAELEKLGYRVERFEWNEGPTYAEFYKLFFGINYPATYEKKGGAAEGFFY